MHVHGCVWTGRSSLVQVLTNTHATLKTQGYGVIRDVLQNHLTQCLCLLKMDLPAAAAAANAQGGDDGDPGVFGSHQHRTSVLKELRLHGGDEESHATSRCLALACVVFGFSHWLHPHSPHACPAIPCPNHPSHHQPFHPVHVGQYEGYRQHVAADRKVPEPHLVKKTVPTAAAVTLSSANPRWEGVPFVLKAGKALDERTSYAKATLRKAPMAAAAVGRPCELLFNIQGGPLGTGIAWDVEACAGLLDPGRVHVPLGWVRSEEGPGGDEGWFVLRPAAGEAAPNAYDVVVEEVLEGDRSMFLGTEVRGFGGGRGLFVSLGAHSGRALSHTRARTRT